MYKGAPLAGVTVTEWSTNTNVVLSTTTTDVNGDYSFSGIQTTGNAPMELHFWATKAGYGFVPSVGSGAKAIRADHTGQFQGTLLAGIYLDVIDYVALANASLSAANFIAYDGATPLVSVPATGQTASYTAGDDGALRKGAAWPATRFIDNADGTVTDALTGLIWIKDAGCLAPAVWAAALTEANQLASGTCGLSDGSKAGQWRLPNLVELESVVDVSAGNPALAAVSPFKNVSQAIYWSSTSYFGGQAGSPQAWAIRMSDSRYINDGVSNLKTTSVNQVWAVKGAGGGAIKLPATGMFPTFAAGDDGGVQAGVMAPYPRARFYLTTPIYYVNARPHLGHAYSTIVCDAIARRKRALGIETWFLTGTDEHGQKIERSAELAGRTPQEFATAISGEFRGLWDRLGLTYDDFIRTTEERHKRGVQKLFATLRDKGFIYKGSYTGQYCVSDELYVDGPPGTVCPDCGRVTETVSEENYFFKLSAFERKLLEFYEANPGFMGPESTRREVISFVRGGLKDLSVSRTSFSWGIPVPGDEKHVIYVWLDALANYITALGYGSDDPADQARFAKNSGRRTCT
jgi:hypothetical protein